MAKSTKALLTGRIQKCKTNPSIAHIGLATRGRTGSGPAQGLPDRPPPAGRDRSAQRLRLWRQRLWNVCPALNTSIHHHIHRVTGGVHDLSEPIERVAARSASVPGSSVDDRSLPETA